MERIKKTVELRTSTLVVILLLAGAGLSNMEVSEWMRVFLDMSSMLVERINDLVTGVVILFFTSLKALAELATTESLSITLAWLIAALIVGIVIDRIVLWLMNRGARYERA